MNFDTLLAPISDTSPCGDDLSFSDEFDAMLKLYNDKQLKPAVDQVFALADTAAAHQHMMEAGQFGKIVLEIS